MQTKFLIVSNARSGSTWLETLIGALPDVSADYEFKWKPKNYEPKPAHMIIPDSGFSCSQALAKIDPTSPIVGSKLVLDPFQHTAEEYAAIKNTIEPDIRTIHLTRSLTEIYYSWRRGVYHLVNDDRRRELGEDFSPNLIQSIDDRMVSEENNLSDYLSRMQFFQSRERLTKRFGRFEWLAKLFGASSQNERIYVEPQQCERDVKVLWENDAWIKTLGDGNRKHMLVDYDNVQSKFKDIVEFIGSEATPDQVEKVLVNPITDKLPSPPMSDYFENADEILEICHKYESGRLARH